MPKTSHNLSSEVSNRLGITKAQEILEKVTIKQHSLMTFQSSTILWMKQENNFWRSRVCTQARRVFGAGSLPAPNLLDKPCFKSQAVCDSATIVGTWGRVSLRSSGCVWESRLILGTFFSGDFVRTDFIVSSEVSTKRECKGILLWLFLIQLSPA